MRLVLATHTLAQLGGGGTYLLTVAQQLQRTGHQVVIYGVTLGRMAEIARERGIRVVARSTDLPDHVDAILSQDHDVALDMRDRYPEARHAFVIHSDFLDINAPPQIPELVGSLVVMHDRMKHHVDGLAGQWPTVRLRQPVDLERFTTRRPPSPRLSCVVLFGNYVRSERRELVESVCHELGIDCRVIGFHTHPTEQPEIEMNDADVVIGKDRVILEAMACGRPAYVYDHNGGDGWVTAERYADLESDNFGGTAFDDIITRDRLRRDLAAYDPDMGLINRDLVSRHHNVIQHADSLVRMIKDLPGASVSRPLLLEEMARLVRVAWQHEARAHQHSLEVELIRSRLTDAERARDEAHEQLEKATKAAANERDARAWLAEAEDRLRQAEALEAQATAFRSTARYRLANALAGPIDRLRRWKDGEGLVR